MVGLGTQRKAGGSRRASWETGLGSGLEDVQAISLFSASSSHIYGPERTQLPSAGLPSAGLPSTRTSLFLVTHDPRP